MIDWVTGVLPGLHAPLNAGHVVKVDPDGQVEWQTHCRTQVEGTHEQGISVRSVGGDGQGMATGLCISGNPAKFLQGHNIFGSDDLVSLVYDAFTIICDRLGLVVLEAELEAVRAGQYPISTIDINYAFELPTRADVLAWIRAAEYKSRTRHGRPQMKGGTIYWGKNSQRWALKAYSKGEEIEARKHRLPDALLDTPLAAWADNKLRLELRLKSKELEKLGIKTAADLTPLRVRQLYGEYMGRLDMKEQIALSTEEQLKLPQRYRGTYALWRSGEDLRSTLPKTTYFRHRKALLEYGIDIALRQESLDRSNVVPLIRILRAEPASIPDWAFAQGLIHHSAMPTRAAASA